MWCTPLHSAPRNSTQPFPPRPLGKPALHNNIKKRRGRGRGGEEERGRGGEEERSSCHTFALEGDLGRDESLVEGDEDLQLL